MSILVCGGVRATIRLSCQFKYSRTQTKPMTIMVSRVSTINTLLALLMDDSAICTMFIKTCRTGFPDEIWKKVAASWRTYRGEDG